MNREWGSEGERQVYYGRPSPFAGGFEGRSSSGKQKKGSAFLRKFLHGKVVLITGATSGIGLATARELARNGYSVYGAGRSAAESEEKYADGFVRMLKADVTDEESVKAALEQVLRREKRIDILINCAGNGIAGSVEETDSDEALWQFDVNFFGAARAMRLALPVMREQGAGVIINISSVGGAFALPFQAYYSASKAALNILSDSLRLEMRAFGVQACSVCPGDTRTGFTSARKYSRRTRESNYIEALGKALGAMKRDELKGATGEKAARAIARLLSRRRLPHRLTVGLGYKALMLVKRLAPGALEEFILKLLYLRKAPDKSVWSFEADVLGKG